MVIAPYIPLRNPLPVGRTPSFSADFMVKDLDLALATAKCLGVMTPVTAITKQMMEALVNTGRGGWDIAGLIPLVEELSGIDNPVVNL